MLSLSRDCFDSRVYYENRLSALDKEIAKISGFCNSVEDKLEAISYLEDGKKEIREMIDEIIQAQGLACILRDMVDLAPETSDFSVFFGIEVPFMKNFE